MENQNPGKTFAPASILAIDEETEKLWTEGMDKFLKGKPFHYPNKNLEFEPVPATEDNNLSLYEGFIQSDLEEIKQINLDNKVFQEIREKSTGDPELIMMCREILFLNAQIIERLTERIDDARATIKGLKGKERSG